MMFEMILWFVVAVGFILGLLTCIGISITDRQKAKAKKARNAALYS